MTNRLLKDFINLLKLVPQVLKLLFKTNKKLFVLVFILNIILGFIPIISLLITQNLINAIQYQKLKFIIYIFILYTFYNILSSIFISFKEYIENKFQFLLGYELNLMIINKCNKLTLNHFENSDIYDKLQRVQNEISYKPYQVFTLIINIISSLITALLSILIILFWKPWLIILLIPLPIFFSLNFIKIEKEAFDMNFNRTSEKRKSWYYSFLLSRDTYIKEIIFYDVGDFFIDKFKKLNLSFIKQDNLINKKRSITTSFLELINIIINSFILYLIIISATLGNIFLGNVVSYMKALNLFQSEFKNIITSLYNLYQNNLYLTHLFEFLNINTICEKNEKIIKNIEELKVENLSFKYNEKKILHNINFSIKKGERVAIVGTNGSGKSTLIKLILKMYAINDGDIKFNNYSINELNTVMLRKNMSILFQDFSKYELTVKENIALGDLNIINNTDKINKCIKNANINFINSLDDQLGLWFNDGIQLSGGQWQKIAIARTFARDCSLCILDEPSAALDPISEKEIIKMFLSLTKDKIGIFVSHRLKTAKLADKIIVLDSGKIVGMGSHENLIINNSIYQSMYYAENNNIEELECIHG